MKLNFRLNIFVVLLFFMLLIAEDSPCQDVSSWCGDSIFMVDNSIIIAKIYENKNNIIRYRNCDKPTGPLLIISTEQINKIVYKGKNSALIQNNILPQANTETKIKLEETNKTPASTVVFRKNPVLLMNDKKYSAVPDTVVKKSGKIILVYNAHYVFDAVISNEYLLNYQQSPDTLSPYFYISKTNIKSINNVRENK